MTASLKVELEKARPSDGLAGRYTARGSDGQRYEVYAVLDGPGAAEAWERTLDWAQVCHDVGAAVGCLPVVVGQARTDDGAFIVTRDEGTVPVAIPAQRRVAPRPRAGRPAGAVPHRRPGGPRGRVRPRASGAPAGSCVHPPAREGAGLRPARAGGAARARGRIAGPAPFAQFSAPEETRRIRFEQSRERTRTLAVGLAVFATLILLVLASAHSLS